MSRLPYFKARRSNRHLFSAHGGSNMFLIRLLNLWYDLCISVLVRKYWASMGHYMDDVICGMHHFFVHHGWELSVLTSTPLITMCAGDVIRWCHRTNINHVRNKASWTLSIMEGTLRVTRQASSSESMCMDSAQSRRMKSSCHTLSWRTVGWNSECSIFISIVDFISRHGFSLVTLMRPSCELGVGQEP